MSENRLAHGVLRMRVRVADNGLENPSIGNQQQTDSLTLSACARVMVVVL